MMFSTRDRDMDEEERRSCAKDCNGAWWYNKCYYSNLNGLYINKMSYDDSENNVWRTWPGGMMNMKSSSMMIRKVM